MCVQDQASEAMEVFNELMESEMSIIVPHVANIVGFCLEVGLNVCSLALLLSIVFGMSFFMLSTYK